VKHGLLIEPVAEFSIFINKADGIDNQGVPTFQQLLLIDEILRVDLPHHGWRRGVGLGSCFGEGQLRAEATLEALDVGKLLIFDVALYGLAQLLGKTQKVSVVLSECDECDCLLPGQFAQHPPHNQEIRVLALVLLNQYEFGALDELLLLFALKSDGLQHDIIFFYKSEYQIGMDVDAYNIKI
jgi:hypothetical protein